MRVLIDTNVLISAALSANGTILSVALFTLELIPVPVEEVMTETQIRDVDDRPILRAAIEAKADVLLTGDKDLNQNIEDVRMKDDNFSATCPVTVPRAFIAFFEGEDYESTILNSIMIGGDCDAVAAMAGSISYAYYKKIPEHLLKHCFFCMDEKIKNLCQSFYDKYL